MCIYFDSCVVNIAVGLILITMNSTDPAKSIPAFYAGQSILLTGATGFLGKVLIEKVLRSCPDIHEIFLLMRPKKGLDINERLEKILNLPLFEKLRKERPENLKKLIPIFGDTSKEGLGLSAADKQMLIEKVTIVFHTAASVKFNDTLKYAILTNTRGTRDICILAQDMKNLIVLVYIGTAYAHSTNPIIEEKVYPPVADWRKMIEMAESLDEHVLNIFAAKCLGNIPNTYVFSKNLSEGVIQEFSSTLPCAIVRPSIVTPSVEDPFPGWIDNIYGPIGLLIGGGKGIVRIGFVSKHVCQDMIPIDIVVKIILVASWKLGSTTIFKPNSAPFVFNATSQKKISFNEVTKMGFEIQEEVPFEQVIWIPRTTLTDSYVMFYVYTILLHILPAVLMDLILKFFKHQPMLLKLQTNVYVANRAVGFFGCYEWKFNNTNALALMSSIPSDDCKTFSFDYTAMNVRNYFRDGIIGTKKFLLNEDMNRLHTAKAHRKRIIFFGTIIETIIAIGMLWIIYKKICF